MDRERNLVDPILLDKIDKLFACGVGDYIALPQQIVVGDQSSGKSSVLEGLTNLPFPRDSGLCTHFATQVLFRRAPTTSTTISIIPSKHASQQHVENVQEWKRQTDQDLTPDEFSNIMAEVHQVMELGDQDGLGGKRTFSEDILKLEVCGPAQEHFSVVDVPGIFRKATEGLTTKADADMVKSMVRRYMENPRSVMLTVVPANVDIATQEILTMAEEVDEDGHRTLGVLTKPDLVDPGAEGPVLDLVNGNKHKLTLGWCLVRNLGQQQLGDTKSDRSTLEQAFFEDKVPWNTLDKYKVGIDALRMRLEEVLASNIRREFPRVKNEIQKQLNLSRHVLAELGPGRETHDDQLKFVLDISSRFQEVVNQALTVSATKSDWFDENPSLNIVNGVANRNEQLAQDLLEHGHTYAFGSGKAKKGVSKENQAPQKKDASPFSAFPRVDLATTATLKDAQKSAASFGVPGFVFPSTSNIAAAKAAQDASESDGAATHVKLRMTKDHDNLEELTSKPGGMVPRTIPTKIIGEILDWLAQVYKDFRGFELGTFDSTLLAKTMKFQSAKWENFAIGYVLDIITMAHRFIEDLLIKVCPDPRVQDGLKSVLIEPLMARYREAITQAHFILHVERKGTPTTMNHYFSDTLEKSRRERMRLDLLSDPEDKHEETSRAVIMAPRRTMSNLEHIVEDMHDILRAYYKVALKRFIDNLCMQVTDYHLLTGPSTPLKLFSPSFVNSLTDEQLSEIAHEGASMKRRRATIKKKIQNLEVGKKVLA